ncbi:MAG: cell division protein FtsA [Zetaproteobacteria bacterium]|nr:cell division protein FtsA [Pseudobdellovibrionaceae bacterium]
MKNKTLFALDLGTTKFCIACFRKQEAGNYGIDIVSVPSNGMRRGMIADFSKVSESLTDLLNKAEDKFKTEISQVVVGVAGSHLQSKAIETSSPIDKDIVGNSELDFLKTQATQKAKSPQREIIHTVSTGYRIDGREWIDSPVGFSGSTIKGRFFVIDGDRDYIKDIVRICNSCGVEVTNLYSEPYASASVTVDSALKEIGVVVADIGGGTTDGIIFQDGKPVEAFTINVAGNMMTNDIAIGLNIDREEAERLKIFFGLQNKNNSYKLKIKDVNGVEKLIGKAQILPLLGSRVHELGFLLGRTLMKYKGCVGGGIVLTGGGAEVSGIDSYLSGQYKIPVKSIYPKIDLGKDKPGLICDKNEMLKSKYATAIGLVNLEYHRLQIKSNSYSGTWSRKYLSSFFSWVRELS